MYQGAKGDGCLSGQSAFVVVIVTARVGVGSGSGSAVVIAARAWSLRLSGSGGTAVRCRRQRRFLVSLLGQTHALVVQGVDFIDYSIQFGDEAGSGIGGLCHAFAEGHGGDVVIQRVESTEKVPVFSILSGKY